MDISIRKAEPPSDPAFWFWQIEVNHAFLDFVSPRVENVLSMKEIAGGRARSPFVTIAGSCHRLRPPKHFW